MPLAPWLPQFGPAAAGTGQRLSVSGAQEPAAMAAAATGPTPASEELRLSEGHVGHRASSSRELSQVTRRPPLLCANAKQTSGGGRDLSMGCDEKQRAVCSRRAGWRGLGVPAGVGSLHALGRDTHSAGCSPQSQSPGRAPCSCESTSVRRLSVRRRGGHHMEDCPMGRGGPVTGRGREGRGVR